jgi:hypothetical protein
MAYFLWKLTVHLAPRKKGRLIAPDASPPSTASSCFSSLSLLLSSAICFPAF